MKRIILILILIMIKIYSFADVAPDKLKEARTAYWNARYGTSILLGIDGIDKLYKVMLLKALELLPELSGFNVIETNYFYSFTGENGVLDAYFQLEKIQTNENVVISILFDTSKTTVQRINSMLISYEFLMDTGDYGKTNFIRGDIVYDYLVKNDNIYFVFLIEDSDVGGLLLKVNFDFLDDEILEEVKQKKIRKYLDEIISKIKTKSIKWYLG